MASCLKNKPTLSDFMPYPGFYYYMPPPETDFNFWLSLFMEQPYNPCSGYQPGQKDLIMCHDWPVKKPLSICQSG